MNHGVASGAAASVAPALIDAGSVARTSSKETEVTPPKNIVEFGRDFPKEVNLAANKAGKVTLLIHATNSIKEQVRDGKVVVDPLK
jgi:ABC-type sugar transport system substrate-binding protein